MRPSMKRLTRGIVFLSLLPLSGCKDSGTGLGEDSFATLPGNYVEVPDNPIDTKIIYSFLENIDRQGRSVSVQFTSERIYGMGGYRIVSSLQRTGSRFTIHLDSIQAPEAGIAILCPASAMFQLGPLSDGLYTFDLAVNGSTVQALLSITDGSLLTRVQPNNIIVPSTPELMRVPPTIIWGQAESITPFPSQNFLDSLQLLGATTASLPPGQYFYFTINADGSFEIPSNFGMAYGHHFLYRFDGDTSMTRSLVKRFAKRYPDSLYVSLFGGRGEMYYTTVLRLEP